jgi:hypothetical protein
MEALPNKKRAQVSKPVVSCDTFIFVYAMLV